MDEGVEARGAALRYGDRDVVEGLDLALAPGRFTALLGPNGCGKSTILRALAGLHRAETGEIVLDGRAIARMGAKALAREVGLLAQAAATPEGLSVEDLVRQGRYPHRGPFAPWRAADGAAVEEALRLTQLDGMRHRPVDQLSGGQRQRAWIAMILAQRSRILLLDEPTTFLDVAHQIEVLGLMRRLVDEGGSTVVSVLHDMVQAARYADWIILLRDGRLIAQGPPAEVLSADNLRAVFGVEVTILTDPESGAPICLPRALASRE